MARSNRNPRTGSRRGRRSAPPCAAALSGLAVALFSAEAAAQPSARERADALFQEAIEAIEQGDFEAACPKFRKSQELDPTPGTLFNLGDCEERRGRLATAFAAFEELLRGIGSSDRRAPEVQDRIAKLAPRVPRLTVRLAPGAPPDTRVHRDGEPLAQDALGKDEPVDPGKHVVVAEAAGGSRSFEIELAPTEKKSLEVAPPAGDGSGPAARPAGDGAPPSREASSGSGRRTAGLVLGGVGLVGIGVGAFAGIRVIGASDELATTCDGNILRCQASRREEAEAIASEGRAMSVVSPIALGVGVTALAAGAFLVLTSGDSTGGGEAAGTRSRARPVAVRASVAPGGAWLSLGRAF